jgi:hypothetical protein
MLMEPISIVILSIVGLVFVSVTCAAIACGPPDVGTVPAPISRSLPAATRDPLLPDRRPRSYLMTLSPIPEVVEKPKNNRYYATF